MQRIRPGYRRLIHYVESSPADQLQPEYSIGFDGAGLTPLSPEEADHALSYSSDGKYYVDTYSRLDLPPVMELRRSSDASPVMTVDKAWRLKGKLLLVMGEMDKNVDPSTTLQVVDRLIKADKDFDFLEVPGGGHGAGGRYGERRLMNFFVRNLMGGSTPDWDPPPGRQGNCGRRVESAFLA
jgi:hypothetical protein